MKRGRLSRDSQLVGIVVLVSSGPVLLFYILARPITSNPSQALGTAINRFGTRTMTVA